MGDKDEHDKEAELNYLREEYNNIKQRELSLKENDTLIRE